MSRPMGRSRRSIPRPVVISATRKTRAALKAVLEVNASLLDRKTLAELEQRPRTRADCVDGPRPCPWAGCRHHLYGDVTDSGGLRINFPDRDLSELKHSCSLDVAAAGEHSLDAIGEITNLTRERVRQVEVRALLTLKRRGKL